SKSIPFLLGLLAGCRSSRPVDSGAWLSRHTDLQPWKDGLSTMIEHQEQLMPPVILAAFTPLVILADQDTSEDSLEHALFSRDTRYGNELAFAFGAGVLATGLWNGAGAGSDHYQSLEVGTESVAATGIATYALKLITHRERPDGTTHDSFPSGHAS